MPRSVLPHSALQPPESPLRFDPSVEQLEKDEAKTGAELVETLLKISHKTHADTGRALRSVHAKSHGLLRGELRVLDNLPASLSQGVFGRLHAYPVVIRLSTTPGDILDDNVSTPRGMAVKLVGVEGDRLPGSEGNVTQDFVLVNGPAFNAPSAAKFLSSLKLLAATTDHIAGLKKAASAVLRAAETIVEAFGTKSATLVSMGGQRETHILGETFYTQAPIRYGDYIAKISIAPVSRNLTDLTDQLVDLDGKPDGLRASVVDFFSSNGGEWEVRVQLCTNLDSMPVEDSSVVWSEEESPYVPVARIVIEPQNAWDPQKVVAQDEGMSFSPWHGVRAHQPLGSIMRVRRAAYEQSAQFRAQHSGCPMTEPHSARDL